MNHEKFINDPEIKTIRALHFDEVRALSLLARNAEKSGGLSEEIRGQLKGLLNSAARK